MLCFFERWMDRCCAFLILLCFFVTLQRRKNDFFPYFRRRKDGWIDAVLFSIFSNISYFVKKKKSKKKSPYFKSRKMDG